MKTIAIANRKGGVGKSTTAAALVSGLTLKGYKVLAVDLDAQRNLTSTMRARADSKTALGVLTGDITAKEAIRHTESGDIIPASKNLSGADATLTERGKKYRLKEALEPVKGSYDYCIIDCPPALKAPTGEKPPKGFKVNPLYVETKSKRLQLVVQPSLYERIKAASDAAGLSVNEFCHRVLDKATEEEREG